MGNNEYYESVIRLIAMLDTKEIRAKRLDGQTWYEIDDIQDLDIAGSLFAEDAVSKYKLITGRYGGYWRYPKLLDFCYLVNPYYPPEKMVEEMESNFGTLLTQYPSGMEVNNLLASKNFSVNKDYIVVGNGAAELIQVLMEQMRGKAGFIRPTFEEYPNRCRKENSVSMYVDHEQFSYSADDITAFFGENPVDVLIIVNPDNPSGNYINREEIKRLAAWCGEKGTKLVIDESFVDFVDNGSPLGQLTLIDDDILETYRETLVVIKSISKSYGIPGIRLGVLASADSSMIKKIKEKLPIWNINSFGEFYMQIAGKYQKDYESAIERIRQERSAFMSELGQVPFIRVIPSQANYIMCELSNGITGSELSGYLLRRNILIKDLSGKINNGKQYIRLAVRKREENRFLVQALKGYLEGRKE